MFGIVRLIILLIVCIVYLFQEKIDKASALNADLHFNRATVILSLFVVLFSN